MQCSCTKGGLFPSKLQLRCLAGRITRCGSGAAGIIIRARRTTHAQSPAINPKPSPNPYYKAQTLFPLSLAFRCRSGVSLSSSWLRESKGHDLSGFPFRTLQVRCTARGKRAYMNLKAPAAASAPSCAPKSRTCAWPKCLG